MRFKAIYFWDLIFFRLLSALRLILDVFSLITIPAFTVKQELILANHISQLIF